MRDSISEALIEALTDQGWKEEAAFAIVRDHWDDAEFQHRLGKAIEYLEYYFDWNRDRDPDRDES